MRILLAINRSPSSDRASQLAGSIQWPAGSAIRLVHVMERWPQSFLSMPGVVASPETIDRIAGAARDQAEEMLGTGVAGLAGAGRTVDCVMLDGRPATAIADAARDFGADLIVLGSHGRGPLGSAILGSVASEVVEYATTPVLVARTTAIQRVVLADDGSASAAAARDLVRWMPGFSGLAVRVVSVSAGQPSWLAWLEPEAPADIQALEAVIETDQERHQELAQASAKELRAAGLAAEAEPEGRRGDPGTEIVRVAQEFNADLIVMGTRGQTGLERVLLGSVARKVLQHAHCSVLVIHASRGGVR